MRFGFGLLLILISFQARAISGYMTMGYGRGGTPLADLTGGQDYNTQAGSGFLISGGALFAVSPTIPHRFEAQLGLGYLFQDDARVDENLVSWSRVPVEALYFYHNTREMFRLGWGATYHVRNFIKAKGANASAETSVENAFGWILTAEKIFDSPQNEGRWGLGLRYLWIKYSSRAFSREADGNTLFLTLSLLGAE